MNDSEKLEDNLITNQQIAVFIFVIALFIMEYLLAQKKQSNISHASNPNTKNLALFNKFLILFVYLYFLYISYQSSKNSKAKADHIALISAIIAVIPPIIMIYAFLEAQGEENVVNPLL